MARILSLFLPLLLLSGCSSSFHDKVIYGSTQSEVFNFHQMGHSWRTLNVSIDIPKSGVVGATDAIALAAYNLTETYPSRNPVGGHFECEMQVWVNGHAREHGWRGWDVNGRSFDDGRPVVDTALSGFPDLYGQARLPPGSLDADLHVAISAKCDMNITGPGDGYAVFTLGPIRVELKG